MNHLFATRRVRRSIALGAAAFCVVAACAVASLAARQTPAKPAAPKTRASAAAKKAPMVIVENGARPFGGKVVGDPAKGSIACDHGYVEWQVPQNPRKFPFLMIHASSTKTWQTTFDGRDGFQNIFLRRGYSVYLTDLPQTGRAGQSCRQYGPYMPRADNDQASFTTWRIGTWLPGEPAPTFYPGVQFANDKRALDQFFRIQYPEFNAPENEQIETDALAVLAKEIGPSIVLTHSSTGIRGWIFGTKAPSNIAAIVSYEPGTAVFPEGEVPPQIPRVDGMKVDAGNTIPMAAFMNLTRMPIQIVWGDYIPSKMDPKNVGPLLTLDGRRINVIKSKLMAEAINRHGGHAEVVMLPEIGITGNTHFIMSDLNNVQIADLLSQFLKKNGLDQYPAARKSQR